MTGQTDRDRDRDRLHRAYAADTATVAMIDLIAETLDAMDGGAVTGPAGGEYLARVRARLATDREEYVADIEECQRQLGVKVLADESRTS